jgi:protein-S-isoprenylcysteine O-methyltransferase Ste14
MSSVAKADWYFIIPATTVWILSLLVTAWDFAQLQGLSYHFGIPNAVGLTLFITGFALRRVGKNTLAKSYSYILKTSQKHMLVKHGIYKHVRHPIYLGAILYVAGTPLIFSSLYGFAVTLAFIPCVLYRINVEEKMLIEEFGDEYLEYKRHTKRLVPHIY